MAEHGFRKAGVEGSTPSIGYARNRFSVHMSCILEFQPYHEVRDGSEYPLPQCHYFVPRLTATVTVDFLL